MILNHLENITWKLSGKDSLLKVTVVLENTGEFCLKIISPYQDCRRFPLKIIMK